jgi:hypothetical protein
MPVPETQRTFERFEERHAVLRALVGLASAVDRADRIFAAHVPPAVEASNRDTLLDVPHELVLALVGVVALREKLRCELVELAARRAPATSESTGSSPGRSGGLLR